MKNRMKKMISIIMCFAIVLVGISAFVFFPKGTLADDSGVTTEVSGEESEDTGEIDDALKGGGIYLAPGANFTLDEGHSISGHSNMFGGGVFVSDGATFTLSGGTISGNKAKFGGAIYVERGGTINFESGEISNNGTEQLGTIFIEQGAIVQVAGVEANDVSEIEDVVVFDDNTQTIFDYSLNFYVDGKLEKSEKFVGSSLQFDLDAAPLTYEECCGYFLDKDCTMPVEDGDEISSVLGDLENVVLDERPILSEFAGSKVFTHEATLDKLAFNLDEAEGKYCVMAANKEIKGKVVVPRTHGGVEVDWVSNPNDGGSYLNGAFAYCNQITTVTLPASISLFDWWSFQLCTSLQRVNATPNLTTIDPAAFYGDTSLVSAVLFDGNNVSTIGLQAFYGCTRMEAAFISDSVELISEAAFFNCKGLETVTFGEGVKTIEKQAFYGAKIGSLTLNSQSIRYINSTFIGSEIGELKVPSLESWCASTFDQQATPIATASKVYFDGAQEPTTSITISGFDVNDFVFYNCKPQLDVTINNAANVGGYAFYGANIKSLTLSDIDAMGESVFSWSKASSVSIGSSVVTIPSNAFYECANLETVLMGDDVTTIGSQAFRGTNIGSLMMNSNVVTYVNQPFYSATIEQLHIPSLQNFCASSFGTTTPSVVAFASNVYFDGAQEPTTSITISGFDVNDCAFYDCKPQLDVTINNATKVGECAFYGSNTNVLSLSNISTIGTAAFSNSKVSRVSFGTGIGAVGASCFSGCSNFSLNIPSIDSWCEIVFGSEYANPMALASASSFTVNNQFVSNIEISSSNLTTLSGNENKKALGFFGFERFAIPVKFAATTADDWTKFASIAGIKNCNLWLTLGAWDCESKFKGSSKIQKLTLNGTTIDANAFRECANLSYLEVNTATIGSYAFYGCPKLETVQFSNNVSTIENAAFRACSKISSVEINAETIGSRAFNECTSLSTVKITSVVEKIYEDVFLGCSNIANVYIPSIDEWLEVSLVNTYSTPIRFAESLYVGGSKVQSLGDLSNDQSAIAAKSYHFFDSPAKINSLLVNDYRLYDGTAGVTKNGMFGNTTISKIVINHFGFEQYFIYATNIGYVEINGGFAGQTIPSSAFAGSDITSVKIETYISEIEDNVFFNCENLTDVSIGSSVTSISDSAFGLCSGVTYLKFGANVSNLSTIVFEDFTKLEVLNVVSSSLTIKKEMFGGCGSLTSLTTNSNVAERGFANCVELKTLNINSSSIGAEAFYGCKSTNITIGANVTSIGSRAFFWDKYTFRYENNQIVGAPYSLVSVNDAGTAFIIYEDDLNEWVNSNCNLIIESYSSSSNWAEDWGVIFTFEKAALYNVDMVIWFETANGCIVCTSIDCGF